MCNRDSRGFSLVEMIVAIVIIGVGLAGTLTAFNQAVRSSADPMIHKQMLSIAEEMMEEILLKPYATGPGTIAGCNRSAADDIFDYAAYIDQAVCDIDGLAVSGLSGYTVTVNLSADAVTLPGVTAQKIIVTVKHGTKESLSIVSWRTDYAS